jgi:arabinogalactan oligomer / maltooligosaccharide transport system permease protein
VGRPQGRPTVPSAPEERGRDDPAERVSTSAAPVPEVPRPSAAVAAWALPSRAVAALSGPTGLVLKLVFLGLVNAVAVWAAVILATDDKWIALGVLVLATVAIDVVYLSPRNYPLKFLIPGTFFLLAFQVTPIVYTFAIAFSNWSTGHILTKDEAIQGVQRNSLVESPDGGAYVMAAARNESGELVLVLVDENTGSAFLGTRDGLDELDPGVVRLDADGRITGTPEGVTLIPGDQLLALDQELASYTVPVGGDKAIRPEGFDSALELAPSLSYDAGTDSFTSIEGGVVYRNNGKGSFVSAAGDELEPGWRTGVGFDNFASVLNDPLVRAPFLRVLVWTFAFATLCVLLSFVVGLFLAIVLDKPKLRFQRTYRSLLVIPFAVPGFLSLLVWQGLLNDDFGVVNSVLNTSIPWLFDPVWAKVFLVSMGALQSIPGELTEAARVDGGGRWQIFRRVTLPLLLIAVAPLLIASFAFNFNNFGNIYLLTGGGPAADDQSVAGATDILITYTYKIAFESGRGNDYGLASAVSILIFFIVATISAIAFWKTKALEEVK